jgi:HSP20 family molecular chaperone IbpA
MNTKNISNSRNLFVASLNAVPACQMRDGDTDWFPAVDVTEAGQEYVFEVDLPGLKPEDIQVRQDTEGLFISGERVPRHQGGKRVRVERPSGAFVRRLPWPPDAHGELHAIFSDGVLELHVPRARPNGESGEPQAVTREPAEVDESCRGHLDLTTKIT